METDQLERNLKAKEDLNKSLKVYATRLTRFYIKNMKEDEPGNTDITGRNDDSNVEARLMNSLQERLISQIREPRRSIDMDNTKVMVQAHKLREIPPESIVRIKMTLVEDGYEWQTIERDNGEIDHKLLPE